MKYNAIVALSFGEGKANKYISRTVRELQKDYDCVLMLQKEIAKFFPEAIVISKHRCPGKYLDTVEVISQVRDHFFGEASILLVAHPDHLPRCVKTAEMAGLEVRGIPAVRVYDREDPQLWTRNRLLFSLWNALAYLNLWRKKRSIK